MLPRSATSNSIALVRSIARELSSYKNFIHSSIVHTTELFRNIFLGKTLIMKPTNTSIDKSDPITLGLNLLRAMIAKSAIYYCTLQIFIAL